MTVTPSRLDKACRCGVTHFMWSCFCAQPLVFNGWGYDRDGEGDARVPFCNLCNGRVRPLCWEKR